MLKNTMLIELYIPQHLQFMDLKIFLHLKNMDRDCLNPYHLQKADEDLVKYFQGFKS